MTRSIFIHDFDTHAPQWPLECGATHDDFDKDLMGRIAEALRHSLSQIGSASAVDMWTPIVGMHQHFVNLLTGGQLREASNLLGRMFATQLTYGFHQHEGVYNALLTSEASRQHIRMQHVDKLLALASALSLIPVQNPEQGDFKPWLEESPDSILDRICVKIGCDIVAPPFQGKLFGLKTNRGLFTERDFMALYVALRIREITPDQVSRICEIGGGVGYVAYYCRLLGYHDYTIIDLPTVGAIQAYYLAQNLDHNEVILSGEKPTIGMDTRVKLFGSTEFFSMDASYDLIVNMDSLPEMSTHTMEQYLRQSKTVGRYLLSINQEACAFRTSPHDLQERVGDVIERLGGFRRLLRFPFWMRKGYVEEVYAATEPASARPPRGLFARLQRGA